MKMCTYDLINNISFKSSIDENKKFKLKKQIVIASITLVFIASFLAFSLVFEIALPYDPTRMYAEPISLIAVEKESEIYYKTLENAMADGDIINDHNNTTTQLKIGYNGINGILLDDESRIINRNGELVKVVYMTCKKTLFRSLFVDSDLQSHRDSLSCISVETPEKDEKFRSIPTEVYYIRQANLSRYEKLSDEEFYNSIKKCDSIWCGKSDATIKI